MNLNETEADLPDHVKRLVEIAETDTIRPESSAEIRAQHQGCYFPVCFCRDACEMASRKPSD